MAIILPHGVLFRGGKELAIRKKLLEDDNIDAVIGLPANLFYGAGIPACILIFRKDRGTNEKVLFIDASGDGHYEKGKNQNILRDEDVQKIVDTYRAYKTDINYKDEDKFSHVATLQEIAENDYNLNIPRYVDSSEAPVKYDIYATMSGGIPDSEIADLREYWEAFPTLRSEVFAPGKDCPYSSVRVGDIAGAIQANSDVQDFKARFAQAFADFKVMLRQRLIDHVEDVKEVVESDSISADIFRRAEDFPLVDKYAAYQILADHWTGIMSDVEIIQTEGFGACNVVEVKTKMAKERNDDEEKEVPDGLKGRIIPFDLVQTALFQADLDAIDALQSRIEAIDGEVDAVRDELLGMEDTEKYFDAEKDNALILKEITADSKPKAEVDEDIKTLLKDIVSLKNEQKAKSAQIKTDRLALEEKTIKAIKGLDMKGISHFLELKWITPVTSAIEALPDAIIQRLADSITALNAKYTVTYNDIEQGIAESEQQLAALIGQLTGDEFAIKGLEALTHKEK